MQKWERVLRKFLESYEKDKNVIAVVACGSYVSGNPTKHSDIDVHIILSDKVNWRKRANFIVDGFLIELFINPPKQILKYFENDKKDNSNMSMHQFITGKVIFDKTGIVNKLKKDAKIFFKKKFSKQNSVSLELTKYSLWDEMDNLQDAFENKVKDFIFVYHNSLDKLFKAYLKFLRLPIGHTYKFYSFLTSKKTRKKYLVKEFPDNKFKKLFVKAIITKKEKEMIKYYEELTNHVLKKMGGFKINGWSIKSKLDLK